MMKLKFPQNNHGYEPQGKPWTLIPPQGAGYYTLRLWRDCSTNKFQYTSFLKFESHNKQASKNDVKNNRRLIKIEKERRTEI